MAFTIAEILRSSAAQLAATLNLDADTARLEARILLCRTMNVSRAYLMGHGEEVLASDTRAAYQKLLNRRLGGEPIAYIVGEREFFSLPLTVNPAVLIPRPETEVLVEQALAHMLDAQPYRVLDLGTGSGAVALAIASQRPKACVLGVDCSGEALAVACENATRLAIGNIEFREGHWFGPIPERDFDIIVSNPPYIAANDPHLTRGDVRFEPVSALVSGSDGLDDIRAIIRDAPGHMKAGAWLLLEHGYDQAETVRDILRASARFEAIASYTDLSGTQRVTGGRLLTGDRR
jgi:release factor glutamine methyltransferase